MKPAALVRSSHPTRYEAPEVRALLADMNDKETLP